MLTINFSTKMYIYGGTLSSLIHRTYSGCQGHTLYTKFLYCPLKAFNLAPKHFKLDVKVK